MFILKTLVSLAVCRPEEIQEMMEGAKNVVGCMLRNAPNSGELKKLLESGGTLIVHIAGYEGTRENFLKFGLVETHRTQILLRLEFAGESRSLSVYHYRPIYGDKLFFISNKPDGNSKMSPEEIFDEFLRLPQQVA